MAQLLSRPGPNIMQFAPLVTGKNANFCDVVVKESPFSDTLTSTSPIHCIVRTHIPPEPVVSASRISPVAARMDANLDEFGLTHVSLVCDTYTPGTSTEQRWLPNRTTTLGVFTKSIPNIVMSVPPVTGPILGNMSVMA